VGIVKMTSASDGEALFALIGHYLASPVVRRELGGYPINDSDAHIWFVANNKGRAVGFLSIEQAKTHLILRDGYVAESARGQGYFSALRNAALAYADKEGMPITAMVLDESRAAFAKHGFRRTGKSRGRWTEIRRNPR
jgi:GNAT superfamily N-acetyltransferase